jgi:diguanylate cyclase (GGDEF)-like protein/PAS domain S-box-containing protein
MPPEVVHRILVVDDQPTMVEWVRVLLAEQADLPLSICTRSERALEYARSVRPTLILQDLVMPGRDGLALLREYAADPLLSDVPVAILSAIEDATEKANAFAAGALDYMVKFPEPEELVARVRAHSLAYQTRVELRRVTRVMEQTVDQAPIGIARTTLEGRWSHVNAALCEMLGYTREELLDRGWQAITHPEDSLLGGARWVAPLLRGELRRTQMEKRYIHREGRVVWARVTSSLVRDDAGAPSFFVTQIEDVTARRKAEAQANTLFESSLDALVLTNSDGTLARVNSAWTRLLGWSEAETVGQDLRRFLHPEDAPSLLTELAGHAGLCRSRLEMRAGGYRWLEWNAVRTEDGLFSVVRDIQRQVEMEHQLREASLTDELTRLCNRRGFMILGEQQLASASRHGRSLAIVFADLDGMKQVNDELGHDEGDRALIATADVLRTTFRRGDVLARLAGDEFAVLAELDDDAEDVATRVLANVERTNAKLGKPYTLSISVGVVHSTPTDPRSLAELLLEADKRMYEVKRRRRRSDASRA